MLRFFGRTWTPAVLFVLPIVLLVLVSGATAPPLLVGVITVYVITVVSAVWWLATGRHARVSLARGTTAGALCGAVLVLLPAVAVTVGFITDPMRADAAGHEVMRFMSTGLSVAACILVPVGALIGALTALMQKRELT